MDASDCVISEFDQSGFVKDFAHDSTPYPEALKSGLLFLRREIDRICCTSEGPSIDGIISIPRFWAIHDMYVSFVAENILKLIESSGCTHQAIAAVGFHGQTLGHLSPSLARRTNRRPYSIQMGSGAHLSRLLGLPVVSDFRSDFLLRGFEGAPLVPFHNAHVSMIESGGNGCYINGGNTSNFAWIFNGCPIFASDCGPFNEYVDKFTSFAFNTPFDKDGLCGCQGELLPQFLDNCFRIGADFFEASFPKSGDPQQYQWETIRGIASKARSNNESPFSILRTLEYLSAYVVAYSLASLDPDERMRGDFLLFGGGWRNPIIENDFVSLVSGTSYELVEHRRKFFEWRTHFLTAPKVRFSRFGDFMEARLMADMAWYRIHGFPWRTSERDEQGQYASVLSGVISDVDNSDDACPLSRASTAIFLSA